MVHYILLMIHLLVKKLPSFVFVALLILSACFTDVDAFTGSQYNIEKLKEIPQNDINDLFQDSRGFIWIGTLDGLHRYDGYDYKTYRIGESENTINSNMIIAIDEDSKGQIWIATYDKGVCMLDPITERFYDYSDKIFDPSGQPVYDVNGLYVDDNDVLWLEHFKSVLRVVLDRDMKKIVSTDLILDENVYPKSILYHDGQLWIGTNMTVIRIPNPYANVAHITKEVYNCYGQSLSVMRGSVLAAGPSMTLIKRTSNEIGRQFSLEELCTGTAGNEGLYYDGRIWVGSRSGLSSYYEDEEGKWLKDNDFDGNFSNLGLGSNVVVSLMVDKTSGLWAGTRGSGVNIVDFNPLRFQHFYHTENEGSLSNDIIKCVFQDSHENLWIGTEEGGVNVLKAGNDNYASGFVPLRINDSRSNNRVYTVEEMPRPKSKEHSSIIWAGTSYPTGLVGLDPKTLEIVKSSPELSESRFVFTIEAYDSMLWVGTYRYGLYRYIMDDEGDVKSYKRFLPSDKVEFPISSEIIRYVFKDSRGNLWIGTDRGLNRIVASEVNKENPRFERFNQLALNKRFDFEYIMQIFEGSHGKIWIGTMGAGLLCYDQEVSPDKVSFESITINDGLPNNTIKTIVEDDDGYLWLATNQGLSKYSPLTKDVVNYDVYDGLQDNEFGEICGAKLNDGSIVMGGIKGINVFDPKEILADDIMPKMFFTDFYIQNKLIKPGVKINDRVILEKSIDYTNSVKLKYKENSFTVGFVGIHLKSPNKNNYKYMLEGFDKDWVQSDARIRVANYTNIPSGRYTFKVNCSNCDNHWCEEPISLDIRVYPPFYLSWLAFMVYFLFIVTLVYFIFQIRKDKAIERNRLMFAEMEKKQVEELSLMRQQFFTNVSHEFKTPLTLIKGPIDRLLRTPSMDKQKRIDNYKLIKQNVRIMMRLISQLMDFRRLDQDKMELKFSNVEVNAFVESIFKSFESWASQKELNFKFVGLDHALHTTFDTEKMELVIYNIVSNAIKNTSQRGEVKIKIQEIVDEGEFAVIVSDTGKGIPLKDQPHIFERFFQSNDASRRNTGGTGIGLAHSKGLVEKMKGTISFESEEGVGATFFVHMPLENEKAVDSSEIVIHIDEDIDMDIEQDVTPDELAPIQILPDRKTLLVVDDNYDLRHFIAGEFTEDYNIVLAEDGLEGMKMAEQYNPDLIISDVMMPNMDGVEMCRRLKIQEQTSHIPIILLTSKTSEEDQKQGFSTGADAYVAKPFSTDVLKLRIQSILKNRATIKDQFQKEIEINPMIISNTDVDVKFMEKILSLIEDNLSDPEFNVEKLAKAYGVSRVYLSKKIKALTGESTIQFQRTVRLKHAAEMLVKSSINVSEVAWEVGYNDLNTFRQRFKERFNLSPSEYRKQNSEIDTDRGKK